LKDSKEPGRNPTRSSSKKNKKRLFLASLIVSLVSLGVVAFLEYPPIFFSSPNGQNLPRPIILYYNYENLPFQPKQFSQIVQTTIRHGFNTLMLLVFYKHHQIFDQSTIQNFSSYAAIHNLTLVPSYYITSIAEDSINATSFRWINLDMESIPPFDQLLYLGRTASSPSISLVSVTSPYGQSVTLETSMDIVETYSSYPSFWFMQLSYPHSYHVCSVGVFQLHSQAEYDAEKNYCLRYTEGLMVFDYYNLMRSGFN